MSLDGLFAELNDLYANTEGVLGTYVSGSASYGGMTEYSDVDFYVLTKDYHGFSDKIVGIKKVEIRWRNEDEIRLDIEQGGKFIYQMMDSTALNDPLGKVDALKNDALERFNEYKTPKSRFKELQFTLGEARNKVLSATKYDTPEKQAYLCSIYTNLLMEAIFAISDKPAAPPAVAWRWIRKLEGLSESGVRQFEEMLVKPVADRVYLTEKYLENLHGVVTSKLR
jgi:predicted nucleotidyltransferase